MDFNTKYDEKNKKIINKLKDISTIPKRVETLQTELGNAIKEDEKELGRPMTYAEMRARYG